MVPFSHMKRGSLVVSLPIVAAIGIFIACGPMKEPKQANVPDPEASADPGSGGSSSGGSTASGGGKSGDNILTPPPSGSGKPVKGEKGEPPVVNSLADLQEGLRWGMSHQDV